MVPQIGQPTAWIDAEAKGIEDEEQRAAFYDHPSAHLCYAWEVDGQVMAVLHIRPVESPQKAVRASILADESDG